jgi:hypothetical protein
MIDSSRTLLLVQMVLLLPGMFTVAVAQDADAIVGHNRIVAREDHDVSAELVPPMIMKRQFWNLLPDWPADQENSEVVKEAMVRDAAKVYTLGDLRAANGDPLAVNGDKLLSIDPRPDVPFMIYGLAGRPPYRCMDNFRVDNKGYEKWKKEHPNFLGIWTGVEWDNEYINMCLNANPELIELVRQNKTMSDTACDRMNSLRTRVTADRNAAVQGLHDCYTALRRYYFDDPDKMIFLRAAWCLDHYALEWGAGMVIMETTNTGSYRHQVSMFNARGAARQYGKPWGWYIATFYNGFNKSGMPRVDNEPNYMEEPTKSTVPGAEGESGPGCGMSVSQSRRDKCLAYLAGASTVQHEDWPRAYCQHKEGNPKTLDLSPHGQAMKEWYAFTQRHSDRGVSYAPVALLLPFNQGQSLWGGEPWSHFPAERPDTMIDAFMYTVVPFSQDLRKGQEGCLSNSQYGDIYDVLLPNPPSGPISLATLMNYKVAIMLGKFDMDAPLAKRLMEYVRQGGTLVINSRQVNEGLPREFIGAKKTGKSIAVDGAVGALADNESVMLPEPYDYEQVELSGAKPMWTDSKGGVLASVNRYGRGRVVLTTVDYLVPRNRLNIVGTTKKMPLVELLMLQIVKEVLPIEVKGDVEYGLNKVADGWWVYLINNKGVIKYTDAPEETDVAKAAKVTIDLRDLVVTGVRELREDKEIITEQGKNGFAIEVGPGDIRIVMIVTNQALNAK